MTVWNAATPRERRSSMPGTATLTPPSTTQARRLSSWPRSTKPRRRGRCSSRRRRPRTATSYFAARGDLRGGAVRHAAPPPPLSANRPGALRAELRGRLAVGSVARRLLIGHRAGDYRARDGLAAHLHGVLLENAVLDAGPREREAAVRADLHRRDRHAVARTVVAVPEAADLAARYIEGRHDHVVLALGIVAAPRLHRGGGGGQRDQRHPEQGDRRRDGGTSVEHGNLSAASVHAARL